jgi:thiol-disulfide isomerase/thioredoxin
MGDKQMLRWALIALIGIGAISNGATLVASREVNSPADSGRIAWNIYGELENSPSSVGAVVLGRNGHDTCPTFQTPTIKSGTNRQSGIFGRRASRNLRAPTTGTQTSRNSFTDSRARGFGQASRVEGKESTYLIAFTATWCGPCKRYHPTLEKLQAEGYNVTIVDGDKNPDLVTAWNVESYPTTFLVKNNKVVKKWVGGVSEKELKSEYGPKE